MSEAEEVAASNIVNSGEVAPEPSPVTNDVQLVNGRVPINSRYAGSSCRKTFTKQSNTPVALQLYGEK